MTPIFDVVVAPILVVFYKIMRYYEAISLPVLPALLSFQPISHKELI